MLKTIGNQHAALRLWGAALTALLVSGCAGTGDIVQTPAVELTSVHVKRADLGSQTFELGFNLDNPNPFPLPVRGIRYQIRVADQQFVGGETVTAMTVPANGAGEFVLTVDLDLISSATQLSSLLRTGLRDNVGYELHGKLDLDLPLAPSVAFRSAGTIVTQAAQR